MDKHKSYGKIQIRISSKYHQNVKEFCDEKYKWQIKKKIMVIKGGIQIKQLIQLKSSELWNERAAHGTHFVMSKFNLTQLYFKN